MEGLQKRIEDTENKIKSAKDNNHDGVQWSAITSSLEARRVNNVIEKSLKEREGEERERQNRRKNIVLFGVK